MNEGLLVEGRGIDDCFLRRSTFMDVIKTAFGMRLL